METLLIFTTNFIFNQFPFPKQKPKARIKDYFISENVDK